MKIQKLIGTTVSLSLLVLISRTQAGAPVFHPAPINVQSFRVQPIRAAAPTRTGPAVSPLSPIAPEAAGANFAQRPLNLQGHLGIASFSAGNPGGIRAMSPYPLVGTPANEAWERNNAWANYSAQPRQGVGGSTLGATSGLMFQENSRATPTLTEAPQSPGRYNFQFSNNEVRSVQQALRRLGYYSGQPDGILGPDTRTAIEGYQIKNNHDTTGQPDRWLMTSLGIF